MGWGGLIRGGHGCCKTLAFILSEVSSESVSFCYVKIIPVFSDLKQWTSLCFKILYLPYSGWASSSGPWWSPAAGTPGWWWHLSVWSVILWEATWLCLWWRKCSLHEHGQATLFSPLLDSYLCCVSQSKPRPTQCQCRKGLHECGHRGTLVTVYKQPVTVREGFCSEKWCYLAYFFLEGSFCYCVENRI